MNAEKIRTDFPILTRTVHGKRLVYLDNAATTQKPAQVLQAMYDYYNTKNANIHRGVHTLSAEATHAYEESRKKARKHINAKHSEEIVFTAGTTEAINLVASSLAMNKGDKVVCTVMEHHSNIVPWQLLKQRKQVHIDFADITDDGTLDMNDLGEKARGARIVAVTHASNVLGTINDVKEIRKICDENDSLLLIDGAQSVPHMEVDVRSTGADFFAFSGHKMLGPTGIGCLYARKDLLEGMEPYKGGGEMIKEVHLSGTTWNDVPWKFEAGTPNIAGAIGMGAAIDYLNNIGMKEIRRHEVELTKHAMERLADMKRVRIFGAADATKRTGVISFNLGDMHAHDIATILDGEGIAIRSGHHCAQPLMERYGAAAMCRASFYLYNTKEEIDALCAGLEKCKKIFKLS